MMCNLIPFSQVNIIFIWRILNKKYERKKSIWDITWNRQEEELSSTKTSRRFFCFYQTIMLHKCSLMFPVSVRRPVTPPPSVKSYKLPLQNANQFLDPITDHLTDHLTIGVFGAVPGWWSRVPSWLNETFAVIPTLIRSFLTAKINNLGVGTFVAWPGWRTDQSK